MAQTKVYTAIVVTYGYWAPELTLTIQPTEKTDVYSFRAMVLEDRCEQVKKSHSAGGCHSKTDIIEQRKSGTLD